MRSIAVAAATLSIRAATINGRGSLRPTGTSSRATEERQEPDEEGERDPGPRIYPRAARLAPPRPDRAAGPLARALARPLRCALGERSYALYLVHGAALLVLWKFAPLGASALRQSVGLVAYAALVGVGTWLAHRYVEVPSRQRLLALGP